MTVGKEFHDWSDHPSEEAKRSERGSPALMHIRDYHLRRWGGVSLSVSSLYQPRLIPGTGKLSAHAGSAVDIRWENPGPGRQIVINEILPFYIQNSLEIHLQAIHDYVGCRVWRANRSDDAAGGWRTQPKGSHDGKMGDPSAQWLHLEINETGWTDDRSVEEMLGAGPPGFVLTDLHNGFFGLFPLNPNKPLTKFGDKGDLVLYAQSVIFFKAGGAITLDSDFNTQTRTRVMDVQRQFGRPDPDITGEIEPVTWGILDFLAGL